MKKKTIVLREDNTPRTLRDEYVDRVRSALDLDGKFAKLDDASYLDALGEIADEIASMTESKQAEMDEDP